MHFICRSFIGRTASDSWSQYWENEPDDFSIVSQRGHLFGLVNLNSTSSTDVSGLGHQLITAINQLYFSSTATPWDSWLQHTLDTIVHQPNYDSIEISISLAAVLNNQLCVAVYNSGHTVFCRDQKIASILTATPKEVVVTSGHLLDTDRLFLCSDPFFQAFTWEKIKLFLSGSQIQDIEENFLSFLYSLEQQSQLSAVLIIVHTDSLVPTLDDVASPPKSESSDQSFLPKFSPAGSDHLVRSDIFHHNFRQKNNIFFSLGVLFILLISLYVGYRKNQTAQIEGRFTSLQSSYQSKINNATVVKNINLSTALSLAKEADGLVQQMSNLKIHPDVVKKYQADTQALLSQTGSSENYQPELFFDTSLINNNPHFSRLEISQNNLYLLDSVAGRIDKIDISNKSQTNIATTASLQNSEAFAVNNSQLYLLKDQQIFVANQGSWESKIKITNDITDFASGTFHFWNGSLYLLAKTTAGSVNLWKYTPTATGFNKGAVWLKSPAVLSNDTTSFAINGKIWIITQKGKITPYTLGVPETIPVATTQVFESADNLVTSLDTEILAFTDKKSTVYVYRKSGESAFSYNFNTLRILSLAFSPSSNTIFVLCEDQKIYKIGL